MPRGVPLVHLPASPPPGPFPIGIRMPPHSLLPAPPRAFEPPEAEPPLEVEPPLAIEPPVFVAPPLFDAPPVSADSPPEELAAPSGRSLAGSSVEQPAMN